MLINKRYQSKLFFHCFLVVMVMILGTFVIHLKTDSLTIDAAKKDSNPNYSKKYTMGKIYDRNGTLICSGSKPGVDRYTDEEIKLAFSNLIGYEDFSKIANQKRTIKGIYQELYGKTDDRLQLGALIPSKRVGEDVKLTIDAKLQTVIVKKLKKCGYKDGAVVVSNYKTGEVLAQVSAPGYTKEKQLHRDKNGAVDDKRASNNTWDRRYNPGSTMKPVLAAAIFTVRPDLENYVYHCTSYNHVFRAANGNRYTINCAGRKLHGTMNFDSAMAYSCNGYFVSLANQLTKNDRQKLLKVLKTWGFDRDMPLGEYAFPDATFLGTDKGKDSVNGVNYLLGAIGQANCTITPFELNAMTNAFFTGGKIKKPVIALKDSSNDHTKSSDTYRYCSKNTGDRVKKAMRGVTAYGTGNRFGINGFTAKTGTAQKSDGTYTVWTTGALESDKYPYSITVMLDNVSEQVTSSDAGAVARDVLIWMKHGMN